MTYNNDVPQGNQTISETQSPILENFKALYINNSVNHVDLNDPNQGKHKFLQMPKQSAAPNTDTNEGAVYTAASGSVTQLFWKNEDNLASQQMTNSSPSNSGSQYAWNFADGLQIRTGIAVKSEASSTDIDFTTSFTTDSYSVLLTPIGSASLLPGINANELSINGFKLRGTTTGTGSFYFLAIGR